ncbi:hypothetical protein [uncultured Tyzzerella sp.]|uniref:hypothetical protein n=1 Tax=uncultured Tyzzerella sp. TaxID=2321398 RepID=UPI002942CA6F|nr:hypothetical protein [uncultured Tyzzerella sp.]
MQTLIVPIIILTSVIIGGSILILYINNSTNKKYKDEQDLDKETAQEFINIKDINDKYLYTNEGNIMMYLRVDSISIDLYSKSEKETLIKSLTAELSEIQYPFKFIAVSRPVDISPIISNMQEMIKFSNDSQKELLKKEIIEMNNFALSGDIVERQFYISLWDKYQEGIEKEIYRKAMLLVEKFTINNIGCEILNQREIMRFINLINNPYYAHLEDTDFTKDIPIIQN